QVWDGAVKHKHFGPPSSGKVVAMFFDNDERRLLTCRQDGEVQAWSLPEGKSATISTLAKPAELAVFSRDGGYLATNQGIWEVATAKLLKPLPPLPSKLTALAWSPDNMDVALGMEQGEVLLWKGWSGNAPELRSFHGHFYRIVSLQIHPQK